MEKPIRVLVANRPRLMRDTILTTFADQPDIEIVGEVADESDIFQSVKRTLARFRRQEMQQDQAARDDPAPAFLARAWLAFL